MTAIYTCIPDYVRTPGDVHHYRAQCVAEARLASRERRGEHRTYTILPYSMEDLPGTVWRNLWTASLHTVKILGPDRWGKIGPDPEFSMFSIGLWNKDQFHIRDWLRVDTLPAQVQLDWAAEHVRWCKKMLHETIEQHQETGKKTHGPFTKSRERQVQQAIKDLHSLTQNFHFPSINPASIALPGEQLTLF